MEFSQVTDMQATDTQASTWSSRMEVRCDETVLKENALEKKKEKKENILKKNYTWGILKKKKTSMRSNMGPNWRGKI